MFNGKILRLALPLITYMPAAAAGAGFAAYQGARKRKRWETAEAFEAKKGVGSEPSVASDNLPANGSRGEGPLSRTYPFIVVGE